MISLDTEENCLAEPSINQEVSSDSTLFVPESLLGILLHKISSCLKAIRSLGAKCLLGIVFFNFSRTITLNLSSMS